MYIHKKNCLTFLILYFTAIGISYSNQLTNTKDFSTKTKNDLFLVSYQELNNLRPDTIEKIIESSKRYGAFILKIDNHHKLELEKIKKCSLKFFSLPSKEKDKIAPAPGFSRGFITYYNKPGDDSFVEMFALGLHDTEAKKNIWPSSPKCMKELYTNHINEIHKTGINLAKDIFSYFKLDPEFITKNNYKAKTGETINYYPLKNNPSVKSAMAEHIDFGLFGIVHTFGNKGLEIFDYNTSQWISVDLDESQYIVNVGGMLSQLVQNRIKPCFHRVINKQNTDRISINTFVDLDFDTPVDFSNSDDVELRNVKVYGDAIRVIERRYFKDNLRGSDKKI